MTLRFPKVYGRQATSSLAGNKLSTKDKKFASELMHQQCWCWGQDIASSENLLLRFGFRRHRASVCPGATCYEIERDDVRIALWGFGMWLQLRTTSGDIEQGFLARYRRGVWLLPRSFDVSKVHDDSQIKSHLRRPTPGRDYAVADRLTSAAANWSERYERWVVESEGLDHRRRTLAKWEHPLVEADEMIAAWQRVRLIYQQWYRKAEGENAIDRVLSRLAGLAGGRRESALQILK